METICVGNSVHPGRLCLAAHAFVTCVACAEVLTHPERYRFPVYVCFLCAFISAWKMYELGDSQGCAMEKQS